MDAPSPSPLGETGIDLDLAFSSDDDLAGDLLHQAGPLADPLAGADLWHERLSSWLNDLQAELPEALRSESYCLGLQLVGDASIAALNQDWRGKSGPTDVLAFAALDDDLEGAPPMPLPAQLQGAGAAGQAEDPGEDDQDGEEGDDNGDGEGDDEDRDEDADGEGDEDDDEDTDEDTEDDAEAADGADWDPAFGALELGDIVISLDTAARQAPEHGHSLERELLFLASHGLLHLLGWDHPDDASLAAMLERQERLLAAP
jgi:probable rRNA maturation factor